MDNGNPAVDYASLAYSATNFEVTFFFQVVFCAVSLAIVFGAMLDRTKFIAYILFAIAFAGVIYPIVAHWTWGGGWLLQDGFQDFAGSSIVHLQGALAALAGALLLGPRIGKFRDGKAVPIPGHSHAADDPRRDHPLGRLDGLQPGLVPERHRRRTSPTWP